MQPEIAAELRMKGKRHKISFFYGDNSLIDFREDMDIGIDTRDKGSADEDCVERASGESIKGEVCLE